MGSTPSPNTLPEKSTQSRHFSKKLLSKSTCVTKVLMEREKSEPGHGRSPRNVLIPEEVTVQTKTSTDKRETFCPTRHNKPNDINRLQAGRRFSCTVGNTSESRPSEAATRPGKPMKMSQSHAETDRPMADKTRMGVLQR